MQSGSALSASNKRDPAHADRLDSRIASHLHRSAPAVTTAAALVRQTRPLAPPRVWLHQAVLLAPLTPLSSICYRHRRHPLLLAPFYKHKVIFSAQLLTPFILYIF